MKNKIIPLFSILLVSITLIFSSCAADSTSASSDWNGNWRFNEEVIFPQTKSNLSSGIKTNSGTIKVDPNDENKIIISGELFGLYSSYSISATVASTTASYEQQIGIYKIKGTATLDDSDQITFKFKITTENDNSESYTRTAIRI
ncbi:MAG: hypothetical protein WC679_11540 [Bacteroidales bacterium]|jgi:hypothetical protein